MNCRHGQLGLLLAPLVSSDWAKAQVFENPIMNTAIPMLILVIVNRNLFIAHSLIIVLLRFHRLPIVKIIALMARKEIVQMASGHELP